MRHFAYLICTTLFFCNISVAQDAVTALTSNNSMTEKIARIHDFEGLDKYVRVIMPKNGSDSSIFFNGECANIYRVIHIRGEKTRYLLDPEMIAKIEFDARVFESHKIRIFGKATGKQCFVENFYSSPELDMFEGNNCDANGSPVSYYVRLAGSRYINLLDGICGSITKTNSGDIITDETNIRQDGLMPMSRKSMTAIGTHLARSRQTETIGSNVYQN